MNRRRISSTRLICIPDHHERSASCPTLYTTGPVPQGAGDSSILPRNTVTSNTHNGNHYPSALPQESSISGAHGSSPRISKDVPNGKWADRGDYYMHVKNHGNEARASNTNDVLGWMSSPSRSVSKSAATTTPIASPTAHDISQEVRGSNKPLQDLTPSMGRNWKHVPEDRSSPYETSHFNNHRNYSMGGLTENRASETREEAHVMEDYEYDQHPSQASRPSMASSTASSDTNTRRMSDSGGVTKRRSISAPKREYRCTKKAGCDAVFSCNSLRK